MLVPPRWLAVAATAALVTGCDDDAPTSADTTAFVSAPSSPPTTAPTPSATGADPTATTTQDNVEFCAAAAAWENAGQVADTDWDAIVEANGQLQAAGAPAGAPASIGEALLLLEQLVSTHDSSAAVEADITEEQDDKLEVLFDYFGQC